MPETPNADSVRVEQALSLLVNAARVSPVLREAVATVEAELMQLRERVARIDGSNPFDELGDMDFGDMVLTEKHDGSDDA